ncbi:uncharacterized protein LOC121825499 [Peromyscus maniculatus bairdii]|uniref:uncharacterized protein LOC121825499 n=1 Tax=Peromyscus maniculatus bairdii TaxID=230844 RepID=UPI003FD63735
MLCARLTELRRPLRLAAVCSPRQHCCCCCCCRCCCCCCCRRRRRRRAPGVTAPASLHTDILPVNHRAGWGAERGMQRREAPCAQPVPGSPQPRARLGPAGGQAARAPARRATLQPGRRGPLGLRGSSAERSRYDAGEV